MFWADILIIVGSVKYIWYIYGDRICDLVDSRLDLKVSLYSYDVLLWYTLCVDIGLCIGVEWILIVVKTIE
jgi:hypothetical protein